MTARARCRLAALGAFAACVWQSSRPACSPCFIEAVRLPPGPGGGTHAELYWPPLSRIGLPAVVVAHGYLANLSFLEIPWAADLTHLGAAALFVDRRGHGRSGGGLFPPTAAAEGKPQEPELAAAVQYLRSRAPAIDPDRIAILGHSDGGTAALSAASADWEIASTVAISASVAPWDAVNHVAPQNLLLVYGENDSFILHDTDRVLIGSATRGYLDGAGQVGALADGSARQLLRIPNRGHVGVIHSSRARRSVLDWLRRALRMPGRVEPSPLRHGWVAGGAVAVLAFLALSGRTARDGAPIEVPRVRWGVMAALLAVWVAGLAAAPWVARLLPMAPAQEGQVVLGVLLSGIVPLIGGILVLAMVRRWLATRRCSSLPGVAAALRSALRAAGPAALWAAGACAALTLLLCHLYRIAPFSAPRLVLFAGFSLAALPLFVLLEIWVSTLGRAAGTFALVVLAGTTAAAAPYLFERMAVLPAYAIAASIVALAAYHTGAGGAHAAAPAVFGAMVTGWTTSTVCALY